MNIDQNINRAVGQRVKGLREASGKTQDELGEALSMTGENVSRKETGKIPFTIAELYAAAEFLECRLDDLLPALNAGGDEWEGEGQAGAYFNGLPPSVQPVVRAMIEAAHREAKRSETTHGRKAE